MNTLLKISKIQCSSLINRKFELTQTVLKPSILFTNSIRTNYTFNLNTKLVKYRRATRPKKTNDHSILLNYEQSQFAEKIGVTKSWNSWNTSNLLDGKRQPETAADDILIRKFLLGTFHGLFASEILIKRRFNTIDIGFLIKLPKQNYIQKVYFLVGYAEELLSNLLKCVVKIQVQTIHHKSDIVFRTCNKINFENLSLNNSILACLFMGSFYVISLYLWSKQNRYNRNEPSVIKRRFVSVILSSFLSLVFIYSISNKTLNSHSYTINEWIGLRFDFHNLFYSPLATLILTVILFIGPIIQHFFSEYDNYLKYTLYEINNANTRKTYTLDELKTIDSLTSFIRSSIKSNIQEFSFKNIIDLHFLRNYVISTATEEFVFRSCMLPLLIHHMNWLSVILITPLFFGTAHLHHIYEGFKAKEDSIDTLLIRHLFQFAYTYNFGVYSSYLFLRTGSFFSSFLAHSFCNLMGFPNVEELMNDFDGKTKIFLLIIYFVGLISFFFCLSSFTNPFYFNNYVFSKYF